MSRNGGATTTLRFAWGTRMPATVLQVHERLDNARAALPVEAERLTLLTSDPGEWPIAIVTQLAESTRWQRISVGADQ